MATVVSKATLSVTYRANTPKFSTDDYVHNPASLAALVAANTPKKYWKVSTDGLDIVEMDAGEKTAQDVSDLPAYKLARNAAIDAQSGLLIASGYTYRTIQFSLSITAQIKLEGLVIAINSGIITAPDFPIPVSALDEIQYDLVDAADSYGMFGTAIGRMKDIVTGGTELKQNIIDAVDQAAVDAIIDDRT